LSLESRGGEGEDWWSTSVAIAAEYIAFPFSATGFEALVAAARDGECAESQQSDEFQTHDEILDDEVELSM
jgi:hypothetical protein